MDPNTIVNLLLAHLAETTAERDVARKQLGDLTKRAAELGAQVENLGEKLASYENDVREEAKSAS